MLLHLDPIAKYRNWRMNFCCETTLPFELQQFMRGFSLTKPSFSLMGQSKLIHIYSRHPCLWHLSCCVYMTWITFYFVWDKCWSTRDESVNYAYFALNKFVRFEHLSIAILTFDHIRICFLDCVTPTHIFCNHNVHSHVVFINNVFWATQILC